MCFHPVKSAVWSDNRSIDPAGRCRFCYDCKAQICVDGRAGVAELADAPDLGSGVQDVQVQVLLPALRNVVLS